MTVNYGCSRCAIVKEKSQTHTSDKKKVRQVPSGGLQWEVAVHLPLDSGNHVVGSQLTDWVNRFNGK